VAWRVNRNRRDQGCNIDSAARVIEVQSQYQVIVLNPENRAVIRPVKVESGRPELDHH
jgi:hypothetical protein